MVPVAIKPTIKRKKVEICTIFNRKTDLKIFILIFFFLEIRFYVFFCSNSNVLN